MIDKKSPNAFKYDANKMPMNSEVLLPLSADVRAINDNRQLTAEENEVAVYLFAMYDALLDICENNIAYFECDKTETGHRFLCAFHTIVDNMKIVRDYVEKFSTFVHEYDFDENTPANGYRSAIKAIQAGIDHFVKISKYIAENRGSLLFRKNTYLKELEECSELMISLSKCLEQLMVMREESENGSLFSPGEHKAIGLFNRSAGINLNPFFGRCLGLHYCESVQLVTKFIVICMAGFSEMYYNSNDNPIIKATSSMFTGSKYYLNAELRAKRFVNLTQYAGIDFCKAFLALTENQLLYISTNAFGSKIEVNRPITIPPEPLEMENIRIPNAMVKIPIPISHLGVGSVTARLLSSVPRDGMIGERNNAQSHAPSPYLIFHCHGGGFVAMSSKSHEVYLREWAARLQVPILSIDYSLSPQAPYPRALEEVFYAYCWAIKNARLLGTTAEKIVVAGDSAGATLSMALTFKCIEQQIRRPDGVLSIYGPMNLDFVPSPARGLCLMDAILPFGILMACLKAYASPNRNDSKEKVERRNDSLGDVGSDLFASVSLHKNQMDDETLTPDEITELSESSSLLHMNSTTNNSGSKFVSDFVDKYGKENLNKVDRDKKPKLHSEENVLLEEVREALTIQNIPTKIFKAVGTAATTVSNTFTALTSPAVIRSRMPVISGTDAQSRVDSLSERNLAEEYEFDVPKDPFLSPFCASDELLKQMPPVKFLTADMDPCLDDCVEMAKKLKRVGIPTGLDVLPGLPHGFLNLIRLSKEAYKGNRVCINRLAELLGKTDS